MSVATARSILRHVCNTKRTVLYILNVKNVLTSKFLKTLEIPPIELPTYSLVFARNPALPASIGIFVL